MVLDRRSKEGKVEAALSLPAWTGIWGSPWPHCAGWVWRGAPGRLPLGLGQCRMFQTLAPAQPFSHPAHTPSVAGEASGQSEERSKTETMGPRKEET